MVLPPLPAIEISKNRDAFDGWSPLSVNIFVAVAMEAIAFVALRHIIQAFLVLELSESLVDEIPYVDIIALVGEGCT